MLEIERKFLVNSEVFKKEAQNSYRIIQGFLNTDPERTVRVRIKGNQAFLTVKGIGNASGVSRFEWEKEILVKEAEILLMLCEKGSIDKIRYEIPFGDHLYEVDEFFGENEGLIIAEIELSDENEQFSRQIRYVLAFSIFCPIFSTIAQTPISGFYPEKKTLTIAPSYSYKSYDKFYQGSELSEGNPAGLGDITSYVFSIYASYAVNDWLSAVATLPYISTKSQDGVLDPVLQTDQIDGVQDLGFFTKAKIVEVNFKNASKFTFGTGAGVTLPVSDYEGAGVLSLGNQATTIITRQSRNTRFYVWFRYRYTRICRSRRT